LNIYCLEACEAVGLPREILQPWEPAGLNHMAEIAAASEARSYLPEPPLLDADRHALFLDLDGTLAEIAPRPRDVGPAPDRTRALDAVARRLEGAVAVLTGRSLEEADRILERALMPVAAVHGLVRRLPDGGMVRVAPAPELDIARRTLSDLARGQPELILEDKEHSVAFHYRQKPEAEPAVREAVANLARSTGLTVQEGSMVCELRTRGPDKGDCLEAFLAAAPFAGRIPVAVGDDLTDEAAFRAAERLGGYGVLVGPGRETAARYRLDSVSAVLAWLGDAV
jgi:trehalose 6-phosphate phosphatase